MPRETISDEILGRAYGVHRRQIGRWRERGLPLMSPDALADALALQDRPGATFRRLMEPGGIEAAAAAIRQGARLKSIL